MIKLGYDFLLEYKVTIDYNLKMPRLIIFIDKDPEAIWEDLRKNGKVFFFISFFKTEERKN